MHRVQSISGGANKGVFWGVAPNSRHSQFDSDNFEGYDLKIAISPTLIWAWP